MILNVTTLLALSTALFTYASAAAAEAIDLDLIYRKEYLDTLSFTNLEATTDLGNFTPDQFVILFAHFVTNSKNTPAGFFSHISSEQIKTLNSELCDELASYFLHLFTDKDVRDNCKELFIAGLHDGNVENDEAIGGMPVSWITTDRMADGGTLRVALQNNPQVYEFLSPDFITVLLEDYAASMDASALQFMPTAQLQTVTHTAFAQMQNISTADFSTRLGDLVADANVDIFETYPGTFHTNVISAINDNDHLPLFAARKVCSDAALHDLGANTMSVVSKECLSSFLIAEATAAAATVPVRPKYSLLRLWEDIPVEAVDWNPTEAKAISHITAADFAVIFADAAKNAAIIKAASAPQFIDSEWGRHQYTAAEFVALANARPDLAAAYLVHYTGSLDIDVLKKVTKEMINNLKYLDTATGTTHTGFGVLEAAKATKNISAAITKLGEDIDSGIEHPCNGMYTSNVTAMAPTHINALLANDACKAEMDEQDMIPKTDPNANKSSSDSSSSTSTYTSTSTSNKNVVVPKINPKPNLNKILTPTFTSGSNNNNTTTVNDPVKPDADKNEAIINDSEKKTENKPATKWTAAKVSMIAGGSLIVIGVVVFGVYKFAF